MIENQDIEFKSIWKDEWLEWICGFCNTTGRNYLHWYR